MPTTNTLTLTLTLSLLVALTPNAPADPAPPSPDPPPSPPLGAACLLVEPSFMGHDHARPIKNAKSTQLAPARIDHFGPSIIPPDQFDEQTTPWPEFLKAARQTARTLFKSLTPKTVVDENQIPLYTVFHSKNPLTASSVLLNPDLPDHFKNSLGDTLLVAVPDRFTAVVFPRSLDTYQKLGPLLTRRYQQATYPCSLELFEVSPDRPIQAVGSFAPNPNPSPNPNP